MVEEYVKGVLDQVSAEVARCFNQVGMIISEVTEMLVIVAKVLWRIIEKTIGAAGIAAAGIVACLGGLVGAAPGAVIATPALIGSMAVVVASSTVGTMISSNLAG